MRDGPAGGRNHSAHRDTRHTGGAGRATHTRAARGFQTPTAAKTGAVVRRTARSTARQRRQSNTIPSGAGGPTPTAAKTGGVARRTARSTSTRRPKWSMPPGLPCRPSRRQSDTIPSGAGASNASRPARLRAPLQGGAGGGTQSRAVREFQRHPARRIARSTSSRRPTWSKPPGLPCRRSRRQRNTHPSHTGVPSANRPAGLRAPLRGRAGGGTQSRAVR